MKVTAQTKDRFSVSDHPAVAIASWQNVGFVKGLVNVGNLLQSLL